jgi:putative membrane protein
MARVLPIAPTPGSALSAWTLQVGGAFTVVGLAGAYARGLLRLQRQGLDWPGRRSTSWFLGVLLLGYVELGWLGVYGRYIAWAFALQVVLILLVVPVLLACGRPLALAVDTAGSERATRMLAIADGRFLRTVASPLIAPLLVPVTMSAIWFSSLYSLLLQHGWALQVGEVVLLIIGFFVALGVVGDGRGHDGSMRLGAAVAIGTLELLADAIPGIGVRLRDGVLAAPWWSSLHKGWGASPLRDQQHAGAILWFVAEVVDLPFMIIMVRRWIKADEREARAIDRVLDERDATEPEPSNGLWWETDPRFRHRR